MADLKTAKAPANLMTAGLGSCIGICLFDPVAKIGGLAHIMLPLSTQARSSDNKAKFADTAIPVLVDDMIKLGASKSRIVAKIAGGAQMFAFPGTSDVMRIGDRNAESVVNGLKKMNIPLLARETGGNFGRTIELNTTTGMLHIRTVDRGEKVV
ncbi:chemotaxis protein CheD [Heliophilum fasciatum]|nr:chemotaxis protein CheD [Heliophilum fasciatum]